MQAKSPADMVDLVFKAIAVAMGVAVVTLNVLHVVPVETQALFLGVGLFGLAMTALQKA